MNETVNNTPETENKENVKGKSEIWEYVRIVVAVVLVVGIVNTFFLLNARIPSDSMENTITKGDQLFGNRLAYKDHDPERYDIVIFKYPDDEKQLFIKRVIGLPGETVTIIDGEVYIDDDPTPLDDSFLPEKMEGDFGPYEVPEDCYFMMGDNRFNSLDLRHSYEQTLKPLCNDDKMSVTYYSMMSPQYINKKYIIGKPVFRFWPLDRLGKV